MTIEQQITNAIEGKALYCEDMISRWIFQATLGNQHIVKSLSNCRFTFKSNDDMKFTAQGQIWTGLNFDIEVPVKFVWTKKNSKLSAKLTQL